MNSTTGFIKMNNGIADKMNGPNGIIAKHNADPRWKDKDFNQPSPLQTKYQQEYEKKYRETFETVVKDLYGESPSGKYTVEFDWDNGAVNAVPKELKHGFENGILTFNLSINDKGKVVSVGDALKHYGEMSTGFLTTPDTAIAHKMASGKRLSDGIQWGVAADLVVVGAVKINQTQR